MNIIIATVKDWNIEAAYNFQKANSNMHNITILTEYDKLTLSYVQSLAPQYIFFPHWSKMIPDEIFNNYECIVFHMTDLPFGRGGSPLQNLISRGVYETQISAIKVCDECDAGDIYLKLPLCLHGGAEEIYIRASKIVFDKMIPHIIENTPSPIKQMGEVECFKRRTPNMSEIAPNMSIEQIFDMIRMLDAPEYPRAFIDFGEYRLKFSRPKLSNDGVYADVKIERISEHE